LAIVRSVPLLSRGGDDSGRVAFVKHRLAADCDALCL